MSFLLKEISVFGGSPFELYEFICGSEAWRYTSGRTARTYLGHTYEPRAIRRSNIEQTKEFSRSVITLDAPRDLPVATQFIAAPPDGVVQLTIYRGHNGDSEVATYWTGRVASVGFSGSQSKIKCDPATTGIKSLGRRATYSVPCRFSVYERGCNVDRTAFKVSGVVTATNGLTVTALAFGTKPDGWFNYGKAVFSVDGRTYSRMIVSHTGTSVQLLAPVYGLAVGDTFDAYAGCDRSLAMCHDKFDNADNYGGFPWKPMINPFGNSNIF